MLATTVQECDWPVDKISNLFKGDFNKNWTSSLKKYVAFCLIKQNMAQNP